LGLNVSVQNGIADTVYNAAFANFTIISFMPLNPELVGAGVLPNIDVWPGDQITRVLT